VDDEVAPFSAARHSADIETTAYIPSRSFGCGCATPSRHNRLSDLGLWKAIRGAFIVGPFPRWHGSHRWRFG